MVTALSLAEFLSFSSLCLDVALGKSQEGAVEETDCIEFCSHSEIHYLSLGQKNQQTADQCW